MGVKEKIRKWSLVTILVERGGEAGWENCGRESREIIKKGVICILKERYSR